MARIPMISPGNTQLSNPKLTTQSPNAEQTQQIGPGKGLEALGGTISKVADEQYRQWDEARNYSEVAQAKLKMTQGMGELLLKSDTDIDPTTGRLRTGKKEDYASYDQSFRTLREDVAKVFTNKETQEKFLSGDYDLQTLVTRNAIQKKFMGNMINEGQATTIETIDTLANAYVVTGDEKILEQIGSTLDGAMNQGFFDADKVSTLKKAALKDAHWKRFDTDRMNNPAMVEENIDKNVYKFDASEMEKARTIFDRDLKKQQGDNADKIILDDLNGKPTDVETIRKLAETKKIDPKWAETRIKNISSLESINTDPTTYESIMDKINNNKTKASEIRLAIEQAQVSKQLSNADAKSLYYVKQQGRDTTVYQDFYNETHKQNDFWKTAFETIKVAAGNLLGGGSMMIMQLTNSLVNKAQQKQTTPEAMPELAQQVVKEKLIEQNPSIQSFPKGRVGIDRSTGVKYRFFPDGHKERVE